MKIFFVLSILSSCLLTTATLSSTSSKESDACKSFTAGKIDAYKTLEILELDIDDYSIGVNNTAKIFCS